MSLRGKSLFFALAALLSPLRAHTANIAGDAWILGRLLVSTTSATGRFTVVVSTPDHAALQTYMTSFPGGEGISLVKLGIDGRLGISTNSAARVDISASGDGEDVALYLRNGAAYPSVANPQIAFAKGGSIDYRDSISSVHVDSTAHNSVDFKVWSPDAGTAAALSTMTVLSLTTISTASGAAFHVRPFGDPTVELVVSNGSMTGGGGIHVANEVSPSSRKIKTDIAYLEDSARLTAYEDIKGLRHVAYRYMRSKRGVMRPDPKARLRHGLLYEDAPASIRGVGFSLNFDQRLLESEMAFQVLARQLERLETEVGE